jgi:hypothetical protein
MIMTYDPYQEAALRRDLPRTEPRRVFTEDTHATIWMPLAVVIVLMLVIGFTFYGQSTGPSFRADTGAMTKSEPSPN